MEPVTAAQMRALEQAAIDSGAVTGLELMERAGQGVVDAIFEEWPELAPAVGADEYLRNNEEQGPRAVVLCGPGNNGGDGFVVARLLRERGWEVEVFLYGDAEKLPPDARANYKRWCEFGGVLPYTEDMLLRSGVSAKRNGAETWFVIDALFGIGQRAPMNDAVKPVCTLIDKTISSHSAPAPLFVAVDVPTGCDADTGEDLAARPIAPDLIVTFHRPKPLHTMPHMADARLYVVDIGL